jgi:rhodanese-related sulfurtransferase/thiol-disulfide isomerase/thioredoxin
MKIMDVLRSLDPRYLVVGIVLSFILGYSIPNNRINKLNEDLVHLDTELNILDTEISNLENVILDKNNEISALQAQYTQLEFEKTELEKNIPPPENKAPDFTVTCLDGSTFTLSENQGKIVLIEFMATWCGYCNKQNVHYKTIHEKYGEDVTIISISINTTPENSEALEEYVKEQDAQWMWAGSTTNLTKNYNIQKIPTNIIIDQMGYVWARNIGIIDSSTLEKEIEQLKSYWGPEPITSKFVTISALDSKELIDNTPDLTILDCRTAQEYELEHLETAINIPVQELPDRINEIEKNNVILVYCKSGVRSTQASQILYDNGCLQIYNMEGGITSWKDHGFPIVMIPP